jgi:proline dehydrogenase
MIHSASKAFFHLLAGIGPLKTLASRYGMREPASFARRFIAGETIEEAIAAARAVEARGFLQTLDYLGESVTTLAAADDATREYLRIIDAVVASGIGRNLSLKLTQLGLDVDRASAVDNLRKIFDRAEGFFVRIDMESSAYTDVTLEIFETLWHHGYRHMGVVLQSDLHRSEQDARRIIALGARIRLVKGAYREPPEVAFAKKRDTDANYLTIADRLLQAAGPGRTLPIFGTHDLTMIGQIRQRAQSMRVDPEHYEFHLLYGIKADEQRALVAQGATVKVLISYGSAWFPWYMRRLAERPANVWFVVKNII